MKPEKTIGKTFKSLSPNAGRWAAKSVKFMDEYWDEEKGLIRYPSKNPAGVKDYIGANSSSLQIKSHSHLTRESIWYALGLLMRSEKGDIKRACRAIRAVIKKQFNEPEAYHHGTFYIAAKKPVPGSKFSVWLDFDCNWREFICTVMAMILEEYQTCLPDKLITKINSSIRLAAEGAYKRNVSEDYTNIAIMSAYFLDYAGTQFHKKEWREQGIGLAQKIYKNFCENKSFPEYNSPTYSGTDLLGLAQWRVYSKSAELCEMGAVMEKELWRDIGRFYHAGMKNLCGPFTRAYGMNMSEYAADTGYWIASIIGDGAPLPNMKIKSMRLPHDFCVVPLIALLGANIPEDVMENLKIFKGSRSIKRIITNNPLRTATAWLDKNIMIGAEFTSATPIHFQAYPVTVHWQAPHKKIGWINMPGHFCINAEAGKRKLSIRWYPNKSKYPACKHTDMKTIIEAWWGAGESKNFALPLEFRVCAPNIKTGMINRKLWKLPGLTVKIKTDAPAPKVRKESGIMSIQYPVPEKEQSKPLYFELTLSHCQGT